MIRFFLKFFFNLVLAGIAAVLTIVLVLLWVPEFQRTILLHFLDKDSSRSYQVEFFQLRHDGIKADGLFILDGGNGVQADRLRLTGRPLGLMRHRNLHVRSGSIEGLFIDLSQLSPVHRQDVREFLADGDTARRERWLAGQINRTLAFLTQRGWNYHLEDLHVEGSILMENLYLIFELVIDEADPDGVTLTLMEFHLD